MKNKSFWCIKQCVSFNEKVYDALYILMSQWWNTQSIEINRSYLLSEAPIGIYFTVREDFKSVSPTQSYSETEFKNS